MLDGQGGWSSWDEDPGAAGTLVTAEQAHSGLNSVKVTNVDDAVKTFLAPAYTTGVWQLDAWSYFPDALGDNQYFILLNTYVVGGTKNWSLDLEYDGSTGKIRD
ncbi:MAG: hypothetical protein ACYTG1_04635, partial [Planctomycetota bacterium]